MIFFLQENFKREFKKRQRFFYVLKNLCQDGDGGEIVQDDEEIFMTPLGPNGRVLSNGLRVHVIGPRKENQAEVVELATVPTTDGVIMGHVHHGLVNSAHHDEVLVDETSSPTIILD